MANALTCGDIVPLGEVAAAAGVSRRTVLRGAEKAGAAVNVAGTVYALRSRLKDAVGAKRYNPSVEKLARPVRGKDGILPDSCVTKIEVARRLGANKATIHRLIRQFGLGFDLYGETCLDSEAVADLSALYGRPHPYVLHPELASAAGSKGMAVRWKK